MNACNDIQATQPVSSGVPVFVVRKTSAPAEMRPATDSDQTDLSGAAGLSKLAASLPDVRSDKVQAVQAAIAKGEYKVSAEDVAHSLMDHMLGNKE